MKKEYDLKKMKKSARPAPDAKTAKVQTSIRLDGDVFVWLQEQAAKQTIPYQTLINKILKEAMKDTSSFSFTMTAMTRAELDKIIESAFEAFSKDIEPRIVNLEKAFKKHG